MTDLDFENDEPLKKCSWQTRKGNDDDDDDDGMPQKGLPAQIHTKDDFQKGWERSSERILNSFRLGSCLKEASFAHLPAEAVRLAETSWVSVTSSGLLCMACKRAGLQTPWAKGTAGKSVKDLNSVFKTSFLKRHQDSGAHISAVSRMLDLDEAPVAPTAAEFKEVWKELQEGASQKKWHGASWSDKSGLMAWALNESILQMEQNEMADAQTISLQRDARRALLLIKFGFCASSYHVRGGVLGCKCGGGERSADVVRSTREVIRNFCTKFRHPPRWYDGPKPVFLETLYDKIINCVEIVTSDSAANEVVAGTTHMSSVCIITMYNMFIKMLIMHVFCFCLCSCFVCRDQA